MTGKTLALRIALAAAVAILALAGTGFIPHSRYVRWQDMRVEAYARLGWIYERIHFDDTPVDVAFIGTSHTLNGIDGALVEATLSQHLGECRRVVNLAMPQYGRNLHWLIVRELLQNRRVGTIVVEVFENESRKPHPLFAAVAEVQDVLRAPALINLNWLTDIAKLPARQVLLALKSLWPEGFGLRPVFDPAAYDGPDVDNTRRVQVRGVALTPLLDRVIPPDVLEQRAEAVRRRKDVNMLPPSWESLEYGMPLHYLRLITQLAHHQGTEIRFLYLPSYAYARHQPHHGAHYDGPLMHTGDLLARTDVWQDPDHLNMHGARILSERVGVMLAEAAREAPRVPTAGSSTPGCASTAAVQALVR